MASPTKEAKDLPFAEERISNPTVDNADILLSGDGIGEKENFLTHQNHLFINKLNYMCRNYDSAFKDVSLI
jgi:hypothetical protein